MITNRNIIVKSFESSELSEKKKIKRSLNFHLPIYNEKYRKAQEAETVLKSIKKYYQYNFTISCQEHHYKLYLTVYRIS